MTYLNSELVLEMYNNVFQEKYVSQNHLKGIICVSVLSIYRKLIDMIRFSNMKYRDFASYLSINL